MNVALIAIGRNEGARLRACLEAARAQHLRLIYVDSDSTDGSVELAKSLGAEVVELDLSKPFTAARARNEGFERLMQIAPDTHYVQFVDGDCALQPGWIDKALGQFEREPTAAVVCGRRRERHPEKTVYNRLCDIEWNTPIGQARSCGGDALIRVDAFQKVGGYNSAVIAGEEPEMCVRLRAAGYTIWRIDAEMTLHDADMKRFGQWWRRNLRAGHAFAEGYARHGAPPERMWKKNVMSNLIWSLPPMWLLWPVLFLKVYRSKPDAAYAFFIVLGKLPQSIGQFKYWLNRARGKSSRIIEYKSAQDQKMIGRADKSSA